MQQERANLAPLDYAALLRLYEAEALKMAHALNAYAAEPCTRTIKVYQYHRDNCFEIRDEIEAREAAALEAFPIETALYTFGIPFQMINGIAHIL